MIGLYIVTANRLGLFKQVVASIEETVDEELSVFILCNASEMSVFHVIRDICKSKNWQFDMTTNHKGFAESFNICIKALMGNPDIDYLIHCHDDVIFKPIVLENIPNVIKSKARGGWSFPKVR